MTGLSEIGSASGCTFESIINEHGQTFSTSRIGRAQFAAIREHAADLLREGVCIFELNCDKDADSASSSERELEVTACDAHMLLHLERT
jgi:hypothetical protein